MVARVGLHRLCAIPFPSAPAWCESMDTPRKTRQFGLRAALLWVALVALSLGLLRWNARIGSPVLWYFAITCLGLSAVTGLIALQRCWKYTAVAFLTLLVIYAGVYVVLSAGGHYEPAVLGAGHVKSYGWAPVGFVHDHRWSPTMLVTFMPLYFLDRWLWHPYVRPGYSGPYPINA